MGSEMCIRDSLQLKPTEDGKRVGEVQIPKEFAGRAQIRILTLTVNGKQQTSAAYYDIALQKYLSKDSTTASPKASPSKVAK